MMFCKQGPAEEINMLLFDSEDVAVVLDNTVSHFYEIIK